MSFQLYSATFVALLVAGASASLNSSQPVITIPFFEYDIPYRVEGSIVAIESQTTTARVYCGHGPHYGDCGLFPYETVTFGPNTYNNYMSDEGFTGTQDCTSFGSTSAVCAEWNTGPSANFPGSSMATYTGTDLTSLHVTITGGAEKLMSATTASTSTSTSTKTATTPPTQASSSSVGQPSNTGAANVLNAASSIGCAGLAIALFGAHLT